MLGARVSLTAQKMTNGSNQNLKDFAKESLICGTGAYACNRFGFTFAGSTFLLVYLGMSLTLGYNLIERLHQATERAVGVPFLRSNIRPILLKFTAAQLVSVCLLGSIYKTGDIILPPKQTLKITSSTPENASIPKNRHAVKAGFNNSMG